MPAYTVTSRWPDDNSPYQKDVVIRVFKWCCEMGERSDNAVRNLWEFVTRAPEMINYLLDEIDKLKPIESPIESPMSAFFIVTSPFFCDTVLNTKDSYDYDCLELFCGDILIYIGEERELLKFSKGKQIITIDKETFSKHMASI